MPSTRTTPRRVGPVFGLLTLAVACLTPWAASAQELTGSGSTFVQPLLNRWSADYRRSERTAESQPVGTGLDFEAVGSQAGIMRLKERAVDFAASEVPLSAEELKAYGVSQFPIVVGGVVAAINVEGLDKDTLRLDGEVLAGIYLGRITTWSDPAIKALNPDATLPDARIVPVRRAEGSGTTFAFTEYLSRSSAAWKPIGTGLSVAWPVGRAVRGNEGVAGAVRTTPNAIGYMDHASARKAGLRTASLRNEAGSFVAPRPEAFQVAASGLDWRSVDGAATAPRSGAGEGAYPVIARTFVILPDTTPPARATLRARSFFDWCFEQGTVAAVELGYVPLPARAIEDVRSSWAAKGGAQR